jgi:hypothetical protein
MVLICSFKENKDQTEKKTEWPILNSHEKVIFSCILCVDFVLAPFSFRILVF